MQLYDNLSLKKCPNCHMKMEPSFDVCPKCNYPIGKIIKNYRKILNFSYSVYGLYYNDIEQFSYKSSIKEISLSDYKYYKYFVLNQLNFLKKKYLTKICNIEHEIDKFTGNTFNRNKFINKINKDEPYILYLILKFWRYAIEDRRAINKYYGHILDRPNVYDFDLHNLTFEHIYYSFDRIFKGHVGEREFENAFINYENKHNNNFKYRLYHDDNIKDSFGNELITNNTTQLDTVIVSNRGIFIPEIKNYSNHYDLDIDGNAELTNKRKNTKILNKSNFIRQINNHKTAMYKLVIHKYKYIPIPIYSFIVDTSNMYIGDEYQPIFTIKSSIDYINHQKISISNSILDSLIDNINKQNSDDKKYNHLVFSHDGLYFIEDLLNYTDITFKLYISSTKILRENGWNGFI